MAPASARSSPARSPAWPASCAHYRREMRGLRVPRDSDVTVVGTDLIRRPDGEFVVLEDNLRVPSGASYMLTSRQIVKRMFPHLYRSCGIMPIEHYGQALLSTLRAIAPHGRHDPRSGREQRWRSARATHRVRGAGTGIDAAGPGGRKLRPNVIRASPDGSQTADTGGMARL